MTQTKLPLPPDKGKYKCKHYSRRDNILHVYEGREYIGTLWALHGSIGVSDTVNIHESTSSRLTSKEDMIYFIECIDWLKTTLKW